MHRFFAVLLVAVLPACVEESFKPGALVPGETLYWNLELNHHAVLMSTVAPYDTLSLTATPQTINGSPIEGLPSPQFRTTDPSKVLVSPDGLLQAVSVTAPGTIVRVIASLVATNVRHEDTVYVSVTDDPEPPTLASFTLAPTDSAKVGVSTRLFWSVYDSVEVVALDTEGDTIFTMPGNDSLSLVRGILPVHITTSDTNFARVPSVDPLLMPQRFEVSGYDVGTSTLTASATAYGIAKSSSLDYRIGWTIFKVAPLFFPGNLPPSPGGGPPVSQSIFTAPDIWIGVGGAIVWMTFPDTMLVSDIVFTEDAISAMAPLRPFPSGLPSWLEGVYCDGLFFGAADCDRAGNISFAPNSTRVGGARFTTPGIYEYYSPQYPGSRGRVVVVDER